MSVNVLKLHILYGCVGKNGFARRVQLYKCNIEHVYV